MKSSSNNKALPGSTPSSFFFFATAISPPQIGYKTKRAEPYNHFGSASTCG
jgi:hypothetical protein